MLDEWFEIWAIRCYKNSNVEISVLLESQCEIISLSENFDSIRYITHSSDKFLVGSRGSSSTTNLSIEACSNHETNSELISSLGIGSGDRPNHIARGISDCLSNGITSLFLFEYEGVSHERVNLWKFFRRDEISSDELCNSQTNCMLNLWGGRNVQDVIDDIQYHVLTESAWDFTQPFCCILSYRCFLLSQPLHQHVNNQLQILFVHVSVVFNVGMKVLRQIFFILDFVLVISRCGRFRDLIKLVSVCLDLWFFYTTEVLL